MTCIVGLVDGDGRIVMGGDSAGVSGWDLTIRADAKVFRNGPFLMGFTSSFRMGQLLRWKFAPPEHPEGMEDERFMCSVFVDAVRECLKEGGYAKRENEAESGGTFIVGYRGALWCIHDDYQVARAVEPYYACGCGESYALGALAVSDGDAEERVRRALSVAERFSAGVRGPFAILTLGGL